MNKKVLAIAEAAHISKHKMAALSTVQKNTILIAMADALEEQTAAILEENAKDVENARDKIEPAMIDRLLLNEERVLGMASGLRDIAKLDDPVGEILHAVKRPNGLLVARQQVPMGVIGIIYEARPNVTADAVGLCLKAGNAAVLRGGSEAIRSNTIISDIMIAAGMEAGLPEGAIGLIQDTSRDAATAMMKMHDYIDVLIPRGGAGLIQSVVENSTIPIIETGTGNCHVYVDDSADLEMAKTIALNAKLSRPSVCNAMETLLVHKDVADKLLPSLFEKLQAENVELRGCKISQQFGSKPATEEDYYTEFLDYILAIKVVDSLDQAIDHVNTYGSGHSEAIVTNDYTSAKRFKNEVDAAAVYVNASTRYTDGFEFGFGAEIGISTQKLHARGPMGLTELTTTKYIIDGDGQVRE